MLSPKLKAFLEERKIFYGQRLHPRRISAEATAASAEVPAEAMAKTVIVRIDDQLAMAVVQANERLDLKRLKKLTGANKVELAMEKEFKHRFDDCEVGAMPPFGLLYEMKEYVDVKLGNEDIIAFNGGTHTEILQIPYKRFEQLANPIVARISE